MNIRALLPLIVVASLLSAAAPAPKIEYDKFKKITTVSTEAMEFDSADLLCSIVATFRGQVSTGTPESMGVGFVSISREWRFMRSQQDLRLYLLADDERLEIRNGHWDGDIRMGGVTEQMIFLLTPSQVAKLAKARGIEGKLDDVEFKMSSEQVRQIRAFAEQLGIVEPPPIIVPFEETAQYRELKAAVDAKQAALDTAKAKAVAELPSNPEYKQAQAELKAAEEAKKTATGEARLEAARKWLEAKQRLDQVRKERLEQNTDVQEAETQLSVAQAAFTSGRVAYDAHPTTRPAPKRR